jgi:hypothetical protein
MYLQQLLCPVVMLNQPGSGSEVQEILFVAVSRDVHQKNTCTTAT